MSSLGTTLRRWMAREPALVVGVGNELRGDDAVGAQVAKSLRNQGLPAVLVGDVPEAYTDVIRTSGCTRILFVDAVDMGAEPGETALLEPDQLADTRHDTHRPSLALVMQYLEQTANCDCLLLGVQPAQVALGQPMSREVRRSAEVLTELLCRLLSKRQRARW
jgi:hydrogenase 3 maturation protease